MTMVEPTPADPSNLRVSDAERERVVALLQTAASEGRLTLGEFGERSEAVYEARTRGELSLITDDLPASTEVDARTSHHQRDEHVGYGRKTGAVDTTSGRRYTSIMGDTEERLVGEISEHQRVLAVMGDVTLDLREAILPAGRVTVSGTVVMGTIRVVVPDGIEVRSEGPNIMGDVKTRVERRNAGNGPLVRVTVTNVMGDVRIIDDTHHKKRSRWKSWWGGD